MEWTVVIDAGFLGLAGGIGFLAGLATFGLLHCVLRHVMADGRCLDMCEPSAVEPPPALPSKPGKAVFYGPHGDYLRASPVSIHGLGRMFEMLDRGEVR